MEEQVLETGGKKMRKEMTKGKVHRKYTSERKNFVGKVLNWKFSGRLELALRNFSFPDDWEDC